MDDKEKSRARRELLDKAPELLEMLETYERSRWMGRFMFKIGLAVGAATGFAAAFKNNVLAIFGKG